MKIFLSLFSFFLFSIAIGQYENSSFYFRLDNLDSLHEFEGFSDKNIGYYDQESVRYKQMVLAKDSISVRFGSEIIIAKKDALAKGYTFKDNKMYGIAPLNGVFYKEFKDTILALYYQYDSYFSVNNEDIVLPVEEGFLLLIHENKGLYSMEFLQFVEDKLIIHSMDHTLVMDTLLKISSIYQEQNGGSTTYIASPSLSEFSNLVLTNCFDQKREYILNKKL